MDYNILLRLLCAHFLSDFLFQSSVLVKQKSNGDTATRIKANALHSLIHAAAAYIFVASWQCWYIPVAIFASHFIIDFWIKGSRKGLQSFVFDQVLHIIVITCVWLFYTNQFPEVDGQVQNLLFNNKIWVAIIAYILILKPSSIVISLFIEKWSNQLKTEAISLQEKGLKDAGLWIGYIERFLIVTFVLTGNFGVIGFLLAAKSIFRYGDLKDLKDIKMTEYVLIGTLASFSIAIIVGIFTKYCFL